MKKKIIIATTFIALIIFSLFFYYLLAQRKAAKPATISAKTTAQESIIVPAIIDATSDIIRVASQQSGIIKEIPISVGDRVTKGQCLFVLDSVIPERNVRINRRLVIEAENNLHLAENDLKYAQNQLARLKSIDPRAISRVEIREKAHAINIKNIQLQQAKHNLAISRANLNNAKLTLSQFHTLAPKEGIVLQINAHINENVGGGQPLVLLGDAKKVIVRVSIDERDINAIAPQDNAYITSGTYSSLSIPLTFIQLDHFIIYQDRLNARVQEALYYFNRDDYPNFIAGQQVDAHIPVKITT